MVINWQYITLVHALEAQNIILEFLSCTLILDLVAVDGYGTGQCIVPYFRANMDRQNISLILLFFKSDQAISFLDPATFQISPATIEHLIFISK